MLETDCSENYKSRVASSTAAVYTGIHNIDETGPLEALGVISETLFS